MAQWPGVIMSEALWYGIRAVIKRHIRIDYYYQPLFALAKYMQWTWPQTFGESSFVVMFGGLHIEIALWRMVGHLLKGSDWTTALSDGEIASAGTADSFLNVSHLTITRRAHQITALSLAKLQQDACQEMLGPHDEEAFDDWKKEICGDIILNLQILVFIFVSSHREHNFSIFIAVLETLTPWFFALDHQNYSRWIPVHIRDKTLPDGIREELHKFWVFPKTQRKFSTMPINQFWWSNRVDWEPCSAQEMDGIKSWTGQTTLRVWRSVYFSRDCRFPKHEQGASTQQLVKTK